MNENWINTSCSVFYFFHHFIMIECHRLFWSTKSDHLNHVFSLILSCFFFVSILNHINITLLPNNNMLNTLQLFIYFIFIFIHLYIIIIVIICIFVYVYRLVFFVQNYNKLFRFCSTSISLINESLCLWWVAKFMCVFILEWVLNANLSICLCMYVWIQVCIIQNELFVHSNATARYYPDVRKWKYTYTNAHTRANEILFFFLHIFIANGL